VVHGTVEVARILTGMKGIEIRGAGLATFSLGDLDVRVGSTDAIGAYCLIFARKDAIGAYCLIFFRTVVVVGIHDLVRKAPLTQGAGGLSAKVVVLFHDVAHMLPPVNFDRVVPNALRRQKELTLAPVRFFVAAA